MIKRILFLFFFLIISFSFAKNIYASSDPSSVPNNKFGIHILFTTELEIASELVNSNGGEWGYVTIPIQAGDKDLKKWQSFFDEAKRLRLIPIIRLATHGYYYDTASWKKPTEADVLDFANFLDSLNWPIKNRYVIIFNEVNRADEWEGLSDPFEYADLLSYSIDIFNRKNDDFFVISAGMDNAAATDGLNFNQYDYFRLMNDQVPGIFNKLDGFASHAYPNPGFSQPPNVLTNQSISSFLYESILIENLSGKKLPIFITETNWDQNIYTDSEIGDFFVTSFSEVWNDENIIAVTPFLLRSGEGPFKQFSFIDKDGNKNNIFRKIEQIKKVKGEPKLTSGKKSASIKIVNLPSLSFQNTNEDVEERLKSLIKWIFLGF